MLTCEGAEFARIGVRAMWSSVDSVTEVRCDWPKQSVVAPMSYADSHSRVRSVLLSGVSSRPSPSRSLSHACRQRHDRPRRALHYSAPSLLLTAVLVSCFAIARQSSDPTLMRNWAVSPSPGSSQRSPSPLWIASGRPSHGSTQ